MAEETSAGDSRQERNAVFGAGSTTIPGRSVLADDFGYQTPVEAVPLPSNGVTYPVNSMLHGREVVNIRAMTAKDEDVLTSRALIKQGTVITRLLQNCIVDSGVNPDMMLSGDRNAVMVAVRITGYGADYNVEVDCPACNERSKQSFNLAELPIKRLQVPPTSEGSNEFEFELPITKQLVKFKFLTGRDEQEIMKQQERAKKRGQAGNNLVTTRLLNQILSVGGVTDRGKIQLFVQNMPARDSKALRDFIDKNEPGVEMKSWMDCPNCYETSEVRLPLGASFFWPEAD
jgi:hypothetical protein